MIGARSVLKQFYSLIQDPANFIQDEIAVNDLQKPTTALISCLITDNYVVPAPPEFKLNNGRELKKTGSAYLDVKFKGGRY